MVDTNLHRNYVTYDSKGGAMLYVEISKALYDLLQSALIFYKKFRKDLKAHVFVINPYDPCVENSIIDRHQITVTCHVDDLKVSHKDLYQITNFARYISSIYGSKLTVK